MDLVFGEFFFLPFAIGGFLLFLLVLILRNWRVGLFCTVLIVTLIDFARRYLEGQVLFLVVIDIILVVLFLSFYAPILIGQNQRLGFIREMKPLLRAALATYILWIIFRALASGTEQPLLVFAGLRSYLLAIPMLGIGWFVARSWTDTDYARASSIILFCLISTIIFGVIRFTVDSDGASRDTVASMMPMEHAAHSYGSTEITLSSSFFASSKRWARYLLFMYLFAWAHYTATSRKWYRLFLSTAVFSGLLISGSRESIVLFMLFHGMQSLMNDVRKFLVGVSLIIAFVIIILTLLPSAYHDDGDRGLLLRGRFFVSSLDDWTYRFKYMFVDPSLTLLSNRMETVLAGYGIGYYGQATQLSSEEREWEALAWLPQGAEDAGLVKIIIEMGIVGVVVFLWWHLSLLSYLRLGRRAFDDPFFFAAIVATTSWFVFFLKSHPTIDDQMTSSFYWFYVGMLIGRTVLSDQRGMQDSIRVNLGLVHKQAVLL